MSPYRRFACWMLVPALLAISVPLQGQVAPTLPSDTLGGRRLPPESSVPRGIVAPTLPSDTQRAGACLGKDTLVIALVPNTPRLGDDPSDSTVARGYMAQAPCANGTIPRSRKRGNS